MDYRCEECNREFNEIDFINNNDFIENHENYCQTCEFKLSKNIEV